MKTRDISATRKIALLATGDEISNGDVLNSNAREIARRLSDLGMHIGMHAVTRDHIAEIEKMILFLLSSHQALIITGGLGPTSDDLTRYALGQAVNRPLVFDQISWDTIVDRLKRFGYPTPPESNRQQALFPEGAVIIPNPNGTASGCMLKHHDQFIFMLPGPPPECLPMLDTVVIPTLKQNHFQQISFHKNWMLFGVSEGQIAETLDELAKPYDCITGYRIFYPYIEFKIHSNHEKNFLELIEQIQTVVQPYLISEGTQTASEALRKKLEQQKHRIHICDTATGGILESTLITPKTIQHVLFTHENSLDVPTFSISGLSDYWQQKKDCVETSLELNFSYKNQQEKIEIRVPYRGDRVKLYAVEWVCFQIHRILLSCY